MNKVPMVLPILDANARNLLKYSLQRKLPQGWFDQRSEADTMSLLDAAFYGMAIAVFISGSHPNRQAQISNAARLCAVQSRSRLFRIMRLLSADSVFLSHLAKIGGAIRDPEIPQRMTWFARSVLQAA